MHKTDNKFSALSIDQCHEQNNVIIKGSGGAVGINDNPPALRHCMVAGPEGARMIAKKTILDHIWQKHHSHAIN